MQQLCANTKALTFPPLSIARYSFIQLSQLGRQWRERKCPTFETVTKGDSNPGSLDCESGILPLSYRAPQVAFFVFFSPQNLMWIAANPRSCCCVYMDMWSYTARACLSLFAAHTNAESRFSNNFERNQEQFRIMIIYEVISAHGNVIYFREYLYELFTSLNVYKNIYNYKHVYC